MIAWLQRLFGFCAPLSLEHRGEVRELGTDLPPVPPPSNPWRTCEFCGVISTRKTVSCCVKGVVSDVMKGSP